MIAKAFPVTGWVSISVLLSIGCQHPSGAPARLAEIRVLSAVPIDSRTVSLASEGSEGKPLTVQRREGDGPYTSLDTMPVDDGHFVDTTVKAGRTYAYRLCAGAACSEHTVTEVPMGRVLVSSEARDQVFLLKLNAGRQAVRARTPEVAFGDLVADLGHVNSPIGVAHSESRHEIFVANMNGGSILVYPNPPRSDLAPRRVIKGPRTTLKRPTGVAYLPGSDEIAVLDDEPAQVVVFGASVDGDAAPARRVMLAGTNSRQFGFAADVTSGALYVAQYDRILRLSADLTEHVVLDLDSGVVPNTIVRALRKGVVPMGLAYDAATSTLWVTDFLRNSLAWYRDTGRVLVEVGRVASGTLDWPFGVAVCGGKVAVANFGGRSVTIFDRQNPTLPPRVVAGDRTRLVYPRDVACSSNSGELIVADYGADAIGIFSADAVGDVAARSWSQGGHTGLSRPRGVFVDSKCAEVFVAAYGSDGVFVYDLDTGMSGTPKRVLQGPSTRLRGPEGVVVHPVTHEIYVANIISNSVTVYPAGASGDAAPVRTIAGAQTGLDWPYGIALDLKRGRIYVANHKGGSIAAWQITADGDAAPLWVASGSEAKLKGPAFLSFDEEADELWVADAAAMNRVNVYSLADGAPLVPVRSLSGDRTGLDSPEGIWVDHASDRVFVANFQSDTVLAFDRLASGDVEPIAVGNQGVKIASATGIAYVP